MASSLSSSFFTLILLLMFVSSTLSSRTYRKGERGKVDGTKEDLGGHLHEKLAEAHIHESHSSHSSTPHMDHMMMKDLAVKIFFSTNDFKLGKKMPLYFPSARDHPSHPTSHFLSREEADSIPFSSTKLSDLLQIFSISKGSPQAEAIEKTLRECETKAVEGETKFCATSLESMLDFVHNILASSSSFNAMNTKIYRYSSQVAVLQNYTIDKVPIEIWVPKQVGCHPLSYPYAVFYCHQTTNTKLYKVSLMGELSGEKVEAVAVCHMETSSWNPNHVSFKVLGIKPGDGPVCHFFPEGHLVWIPSNLIVT
ncbi:BURP domain-containing protein BNM2C [Macadamia integrifolia]|uniref:BURP domain-containing protein BNM2C n=1 Tax=Macadamia integrifolia TaxID=60698 RepID=UPI001C529BBD|nr:BURP domain-containing protein BNM2C [Macadamia integrifolia]